MNPCSCEFLPNGLALNLTIFPREKERPAHVSLFFGAALSNPVTTKITENGELFILSSEERDGVGMRPSLNMFQGLNCEERKCAQ